VPAEKINDDRLYRTLDVLLPHKAAIKRHLKVRLDGLLEIPYDLPLYDLA